MRYLDLGHQLVVNRFELNFEAHKNRRPTPYINVSGNIHITHCSRHYCSLGWRYEPADDITIHVVQKIKFLHNFLVILENPEEILIGHEHMTTEFDIKISMGVKETML